ncbi:MAG: FAD-dependent oxidoreductase [Rhodospirillales bacterium]|nr:FAD-dependent oxidoreductase [Rhodospirillales bacterium]
MSGQIHVVGAGLSGLAAAVDLAASGRRVVVYEHAGHAGGRCRSFVDDTLARTIDNGNHLVLSGNTSLHAYLRTIGAVDGLTGPPTARFPFLDLATGERWDVRPGAGRIPWWVLSPSRRIPGTRLGEYLATWRLACAGANATVAESVGGNGTLYRRFWEPLAVAVLNTAAEEGAARLLWPVLRETFGRGEAACRPRIAERGLSSCFVDPALTFLRRRGVDVRLHARLRSLESADGEVRRLCFASVGAVDIGPDDAVVLAVPPNAAATVLPGLTTPMASRAIVNAHFLLPRPFTRAVFLGLVGGVSHWIFVRDDVASVTVSAAEDLAGRANDEIVARVWPEVTRALNLGDVPLSTWKIIKEKRATFAQTPAEVLRRPPSRTGLRNLRLAGDWTDTGLPATIEGSVRSGHTAAESLAQLATLS